MKLQHTQAPNIKVIHTEREPDLWLLFRILSDSEYHMSILLCSWVNTLKLGLLVEDGKDLENIFWSFSDQDCFVAYKACLCQGNS